MVGISNSIQSVQLAIASDQTVEGLENLVPCIRRQFILVVSKLLVMMAVVVFSSIYLIYPESAYSDPQ